MKKIIFLLLLALPFVSVAQNKGDISKYLKGAVTMTNGKVTFQRDFEVPGKSKAELFDLLKAYTQKEILEGENHLVQCGITDSDSIRGILAADVEENLYFKKTALETIFYRFYYQLIYKIEDGKFNITMRRIQYIDENFDSDEILYAEDWITDFNALKNNGTKLKRKCGKFRRATIDRKDEIFIGAGKATGAKFKTKIIVVEE